MKTLKIRFSLFQSRATLNMCNKEYFMIVVSVMKGICSCLKKMFVNA